MPAHTWSRIERHEAVGFGLCGFYHFPYIYTELIAHLCKLINKAQVHDPEEAVIVNALVRQALVSAQEVMGENGLNAVLPSIAASK